MLRQLEWWVQNEQGFASNYFISLKILFQFKNLLCTNLVPILVLFESAGLLFYGAFSLWVSLIWYSVVMNFDR